MGAEATAAEAEGQASVNTTNLQQHEMQRQEGKQAVSMRNIYQLGQSLFPDMIRNPDQLFSTPPALLGQIAQNRGGGGTTQPYVPNNPGVAPLAASSRTRRPRGGGGSPQASEAAVTGGAQSMGQFPDRPAHDLSKPPTQGGAGRIHGYAKGGEMAPGETALVGEEGPEIKTATEPTTIIPNPGSLDGPGGIPPMPPEVMNILAMLMEGKGAGGPGGPGGPGGGMGMGPGGGMGGGVSPGPMGGGAPPAGPGGLPMMEGGGQLPTGQSAIVGEGGAEIAVAGQQGSQLQPSQSGGTTSAEGTPWDWTNPSGVTNQDPEDVADQERKNAERKNYEDVQQRGTAPGGGFRDVGEAYTGNAMNLLSNPGQLDPIAYERAQAQANQSLNAGNLSLQGMMGGRGWDPNSPMGQMLQLSNVNANQHARNSALQDLTMKSEDLWRKDIAQGSNMYMQGLQALLGLAGQQREAAQPPFQQMESGWGNAGSNVNGTLNAVGGMMGGMGSSERWKENIETISEALPKVLALRGVEYNWREELPSMLRGMEGEADLGLVAEEVYEVLPSASILDGDGIVLGVKYPHVVGLLVEAIKEQQAQIEALREKVDAT